MHLRKPFQKTCGKFREECIQFAQLLNTDEFVEICSKPQAAALYRLMIDNSLEGCFPNIEIALRIYLSLMMTNRSAERSFSKLKNVKNTKERTQAAEQDQTI